MGQDLTTLKMEDEFEMNDVIKFPYANHSKVRKICDVEEVGKICAKTYLVEILIDY